MTRRRLLLCLISLWCVFTAGGVSADELLVCGADEVFVVDINTADPASSKKIWSWLAADRDDLPKRFRTMFRSTDDCKPIDGGKRVLISSSSGGCALVERPSGKVLWYAYVGNAHSVEMLPGDRIAVAGSVHKDGNRVAIYDLANPDKLLFKDELISGHGVHWDAKRRLLWALGFDGLRAYRLVDWDSKSPKLERAATYKLPTPGGHELSPTGRGDGLIVSSNTRVYVFDRKSRKFTPHPELGDVAKVKGVSVHRKTGRVAYVHGEGGHWSSPRVRFLNPKGQWRVEGARRYKARWVQ